MAPLTTQPGDADERHADEVPRGAPAPAASTPAGLPPRIAAAVDTPGTPLDAPTRRGLESRYGTDLAAVRLHTGAAADAARADLGATAFTAGTHVVLGRDAPARVLAHEIGHVLAPPRGALIGRQAPTTPAATAATPGERVRQWLDEHQASPPATQPVDGEHHVILGGADLTVSQAVTEAMAATHQPRDVVTAAVLAVASRRVPLGLDAAVISPENQVPGLHVGNLVEFGKADELQAIDTWLHDHDFALPDARDMTGTSALLDSDPVTIPQLADRALAMLRARSGDLHAAYLTRQEVLDHVRQQYLALRAPQTQVVLGYTIVPFQASTAAPDPLNPLRTQHQLSITLTHVGYPPDQLHLESSLIAAIAFDDVSPYPVSVQAGGQEALVLSLLHGWLQVSGIGQGMLGMSRMRSATLTGTATVYVPTLQVLAGGQILFTPNFHHGALSFLRGHAQIGVQALGGLNVPLDGSSTSAIGQATGVFNWQF